MRAAAGGRRPAQTGVPGRGVLRRGPDNEGVGP